MAKINRDDVTFYEQAWQRANASDIQKDPITDLTRDEIRIIMVSISRRRVPTGVIADGVTGPAVVAASKWMAEC